MRTYWLWHGKRCMTAVRLAEGATDQEVIQKALDDHEVCPTVGPEAHEAPFEYANRLHHSEVRIYNADPT